MPVINDLVIVPNVIVGVVRIVDAVIMMFGASDSCDGRKQRDGQQERTSVFGIKSHARESLLKLVAAANGRCCTPLCVRGGKMIAPDRIRGVHLLLRNRFHFLSNTFQPSRIVIDWLI